MKKAGTEAGLPARSLGSASALLISLRIHPAQTCISHLLMAKGNHKKKGSMNILVARCQRSSALCPWHPWPSALENSQRLFGRLLLGRPARGGLGEVLRAAEHLQLYVTSTGGAVSPAEAVPVQGLGCATRITLS